MAITFVGTDGWVSGGAAITPTIHASAAAGDMMLCRVVTKPYNGVNSMPAGWVSIGSFADGTVATASNVGSVLVEVFWKEHDGSEADPQVDNASNNISGACITVYRKASGDTWDTPVGDGGGFTNSAGVAFTQAVQSHITVASGDMVDAWYGVRDNATLTSPTLTQTGVTYDAVTEAPASAFSTSSGADLAADGGYALATAGTSSAAAVVGGTINTAETGAVWMTRLRAESAPATQDITPALVQNLVTTFAPTVEAASSGVILFDANSTESTQGDTSLTWSHTCTGTDRILFVAVSQFRSGAPLTVTGTYDGVSMTELSTQTYGAGGDQKLTVLYLVNPASGTNDIVLSVGSTSWMAAAAASFTGVDQTTPVGTPSTTTVSSATSVSQDISSETGDMVVDFLVWYNGAHTVGADQTVRAFFDGGSADDSTLISTEAGASTVTMSHSWSAGEHAAHTAVNMNVAGAAAQDVTPALTQQLVSVFAPTVTPGAASVTPTLTQNLISAFTITVAPGAVTITPALTEQVIVPFGPTVTVGGASITPALVEQIIAAFGPAFVQQQFMTPDLVTQTITVFDVSVSPSQPLTVDLVQQLISVFAPSVTPGAATVAPALVENQIIVFAPSVSAPVSNIAVLLTQQLISAFDPSFSLGAVTIAPPLVTQLFIPQTITFTFPTYTFEAPTSSQLWNWDQVEKKHRMWRFYGGFDVALTVVITDGVASPLGRQGLTVAEISGADSGSGEGGKAVFKGPNSYQVTFEEKAVLEAAGYTVT